MANLPTLLKHFVPSGFQKKYHLIFYLTFSFISFFILPVFARPLHDLASPVVAIDDSIYLKLDILQAHGLLPSQVAGIKPYTRAEIARQIQEASTSEKRADLSEKSQSLITRMINDLKKEYHSELAGLGFEENFKKTRLSGLKFVELNLMQLDGNHRAYFSNSSSLKARMNPLVNYQQGRHFADGTQLSVSSRSELQLGRHISVAFSPYLQLQLYTQDQNREQGLFVEDLSLNFNWFNTQLDIGRQPLHWGQSHRGGVLLSNNARSLDGLFLSNPHPWETKLGSIKYSFFLATLGPEQRFDHSLISGLKLAYKPWSFFEFGLARSLIFGGTDSPSASVSTQIGEFFGARPSGGDDGNFSNSISGFEMRFTLPFLRQTQVYSEFYFDDFNLSHIPRSFVQDAGILAGLFVPRLNQLGTWSLRLEGRKMSGIMFQHNTWSDGWSQNGFLLGDALGPDSESLRLELMKIFYPHTVLAGEFNLERIDSDIYRSDKESGREVSRNGQAEMRYRFNVSATHDWSKRLSSKMSVGYERVSKPDFLSRGSQDNFMAQVGLRITLDDLTTVEK